MSSSKPINSIFLMLITPAYLFAGTFSFSLYGISFSYPVDWSIVTQTSSSVELNIGTNRSLFLELLPDNSPSSYVVGKLNFLDSLFLNMTVWGRENINIAGHLGYSVGTTQASRTTFTNFHTRWDFVRIPKVQRVLVCYYVNYYYDALYWSTDIQKIKNLYSTFAIVGDTIPDRTTLSNTQKSYRNWITIKYPNNFYSVRDSSNLRSPVDGISVYDSFDKVFGKFRFETTHFITTPIYQDVISSYLNLSLYIDTMMNGSDTFAYITDTTWNTGRFVEYIYGLKGFPNYTYMWINFVNNTIEEKIFYKGYYADLGWVNIINPIILSATFSEIAPVTNQRLTTTKSPLSFRYMPESGIISIGNNLAKTSYIDIYSLNGKKAGRFSLAKEGINFKASSGLYIIRVKNIAEPYFLNISK